MSNYQQTKVFSIFIDFKDGTSKLVGYLNVREQLESADFKAVENKLWSMFKAGGDATKIGKFYIVPEVKRSETAGDLSELLEDEEEHELTADELDEKLGDDTPF